MSYKVTKRNEAYRYEAPGHYDVLTTRLHDPVDVNEGTIVNGLTAYSDGVVVDGIRGKELRFEV